MPDERVTVKTTAGVGMPRRASVGGTSPAVLRPNSVASAVQPIGTSGPMHAPGAGVLAVATSLPVPGVLAVADAFDPNDLDRMQQRQFTGGRPSGFAEAINQLREAYRRRERDASEDARAAVRVALGTLEAAIIVYNEQARRAGLPVIERPSDVLAGLVDDEGRALGDPAGLGGLLAGIEMMPAWRADP